MSKPLTYYLPAISGILVLAITFLLQLIPFVSFIIFLFSGLLAGFIAVSIQHRHPREFFYYGRVVLHAIGGLTLIFLSIFLLPFTSIISILLSLLAAFLTGWVMERTDKHVMISHKPHKLEISKSSPHVAGIFWTISFIVVLAFFPGNIAYAALLIFVVGDAAAFVIGTLFGRTRHPINIKKTVEGTAAYFVVAFVAAISFVNPFTAFVGALAAAIIEFLPLKVDDNLTVPIAAAVVMSFVEIV